MRPAASPRTIAALALSTLALLAVHSSASVAAPHVGAGGDGLVLALRLASAAATAKLTLAIPGLGPHATFGLPLLAAVAAPYIARSALRRLGGASGAQGLGAPSAPPRPRPYNLPSRVSAALEAAARARIAASAEHCPAGRAPL